MDNQYLLVAAIAIILLFIYILRGKNITFLDLTPAAFRYKDNNSSEGDVELTQELINYYDKILRHFISYYPELDKFNRRRFILRLHDFINSMTFLGREDQEINLKVCTLCAAPAIQLTFGLESYKFNHFHTIVVYPQQFYSEHQNDYVKGGVSRGDAIFFSFLDLEKGYRHDSDGVNLGLHEMAHAIHIEYFDDDFEKEFPNWEKTALEEMPKILKQPNPILRNYAMHNKHELFAVCCEVFFEQPEDLKRQSERLYLSMKKLLNQDPCNL